MIVPIKLLIEIEVAENIYTDPTDDFFKQLELIKADSIKKHSYKILSQKIEDEDCKEAIFQYGLTTLVMPEGHYYATGTPYDREANIIVTFQKFLDRIITSDHLIIIDPYLFYANNDDEKYSNFVSSIFKNHLKKLNKITFITKKSKSKRQTKEAIINKFSKVKSKLKIEVKYSDLFHDRFWICDERGIFVGTSLNGIGQSYCLIDYIRREDIYDIRNYLTNEKIV